ncbi:hypothetical protein IEQ34_011007 [Dendrobium chrysotoxum]|uniref:Uncharacterized protein n=1 Tax=Dendrobium chrysotoxum TaxID=161865 RepID=A0AAV7GX24_DENCH|nr:hypothetical protein IEQ34_011007 [Dendrobium chrysotoxum]
MDLTGAASSSSTGRTKARRDDEECGIRSPVRELGHRFLLSSLLLAFVLPVLELLAALVRRGLRELAFRGVLPVLEHQLFSLEPLDREKNFSLRLRFRGRALRLSAVTRQFSSCFARF